MRFRCNHVACVIAAALASHPAPQLAMVEPHILFAAEPPVVAAVTTGDAQIMPGSPVAGKATLRYRF